MNPILFKSCTILFLCVAVHAEYEGFIFDRFHHVVFNLPDVINENEKAGAVAVACPIEESKEAANKEFLENCSITNNALIVRETYERDSPAHKVDRYICEQPFKISLVYNIIKRAFEFGFEVFYGVNLHDRFKSSNYKNYIPFKEAIDTLKSKSGMVKLYGKNFFSRIQDVLPGAESRNKWFNNNNKMKFVWLNMFRMKYDPSELIVRNVTYEIRRNTKEQIPPKCKDNQYTLGSEVYKDTIEGTVESLYTNQAKIFEEFKAPSVTPPCEGEKCPLPQPNPCENNNDCLDKYSLIPIDQFHLFRNRPLLCSNLFTTPIWKDATKGALEKLDRYLYALFKFLDEKRLHVIAGVSPTQLMLPLKNQSPKKESKKEPVFLDHKNKKIPVPEFVYKLVKYYPRACDSKDKSCEYAVMFIAHNDPNFKPKDKICPGKEDFTKTLGWNAITTDISGNQYNNIYACPNDKKVLKKIYSFKTFLPSTPSPTPTSKNLNLQKFPVYNKDTNTVDENNDFVGQVNAMFDELATNGERLEFKDIITWYQEDSENVEDMDEDSELESDSPKAESPRN